MRNSIRTRLTVAFISLAVCPLLLVGAVLAWQSFATQQQQALNWQREMARRVATEVAAFFEGLENELRLVSKAQVLPGISQSEQHNILTLLMSQDIFDDLVLLDNEGREQIHLSRLSLTQTVLGDRAGADEFVIPHTTGEVYYSPVRFDEITGEPLMTIAVPLLDIRTGLTDGVLVSEVRVKKIWDLIADVRVSQDQSVYIVDAQNRVVAHRNPSVVLRGTRFDVPDQDGIQPGLTGSNAVLAVETTRFGQQEFNIVAEQAVSEALALAINTVVITATLVVAALAVSTALGLLTVRQIVRPIRAMATTAQAISAGDLSQKVQVTSRDEVGLLALAFNDMTTQLRALINNLERQITDRKRAEEALRESEERLRQIASSLREAIWLRDVQTRQVLYVNPAFEELTGWTCESFYENRDIVIDAIHPDDEEWVIKALDQRFEDVPFDKEHRIIHLDGSVRWISSRSFPVRNEAGEVYRWASTMEDITERKRAEEALRESEEKFRTFTESAPVAIMIYQNYQCVYANPAAETITGFTNKELLSMKFWDIAHPDHKDAIEEWSKAIARDESAPKQHELRIVAKDGSEKWIDGRLELTEYEGKRAALISAIDITDRKQVEKEREQLLGQVREQAQRVQQIIDTVPEGVILMDTDHRTVLANPAGKRELNTLAGAQVGDVLTHLGERPLAEILTSPPKGLWHEVAPGNRSFQIIARPIEDGPEPRGWVLVIHDVTHQRETERRIQQQERLVAVGQLAAGIAHDFNNIIAVISLYTGMMLKTPGLPDKTYARLETVKQQAGRAGTLIQQVLDFSRRAVLERGPIDMLVFLREQLELLRRTLPENIKIDLTYGKDEYVVRADPARIQQVVVNLATNARDAMPEGGQLRISLDRIHVKGRSSAPLPEMAIGDWVRVKVADTGTGIPPDVMEHIFDPFFTTKPPGQGTGLGLAQVYGIIKQHDGYTDVSTTVGEGTTFALYLPALSVQQAKTLPPRPQPLITGQGQTILVIEDEAATRKAIVDSLEPLGYQVLEAANGQKALTIFEQREGQIDLVLSDIVMPKMGGKALFLALKQRYPGVKVVLMSGHPLEETEIETLLADGLSDWLPKPPTLEQLARVVAQALAEDVRQPEPPGNETLESE